MALGRGQVVSVGLSILFVSRVGFSQLGTATPAPEAAPNSGLEHEREPDPPTPSSASVTVIAPELAQGVSAGSTAQTYKRKPKPAEPESHWYGWQTLTADALSVAAIAGGLGLNQPYLGFAGLGGYLLAAPGVHWYHGALGKGFLSLGLRVSSGAMVVVGGAVCAVGAFTGGNDALCALPIIGLVMIPAAIAVDASLAWQVESPQGAIQRHVSPWFSATRRAGGVVWQGTF